MKVFVKNNREYLEYSIFHMVSSHSQIHYATDMLKLPMYYGNHLISKEPNGDGCLL
jgi:hypothetical protein